MSEELKFNRKAYMAGECTHQQYYAQFATPAVIRLVGNHIGVSRIVMSADEHFNDIPLREWDALEPSIRSLVGREIAEANKSTSGGVACISLSDCVCAAKAAAQLIREE